MASASATHFEFLVNAAGHRCAPSQVVALPYHNCKASAASMTFSSGFRHRPASQSDGRLRLGLSLSKAHDRMPTNSVKCILRQSVCRRSDLRFQSDSLYAESLWLELGLKLLSFEVRHSSPLTPVSRSESSVLPLAPLPPRDLPLSVLFFPPGPRSLLSCSLLSPLS